MKATLTQENPVFTLAANGAEIAGMRECGQLGPISLLKNDKGHEAYVYNGASPYAKAFTNALGGGAHEVIVIAVNPPALDLITPAPVAAPTSTEAPAGDTLASTDTQATDPAA
jgi:hypothetical protein